MINHCIENLVILLVLVAMHWQSASVLAVEKVADTVNYICGSFLFCGEETLRIDI